jgi:hypothetical protein
MSDTTRAEAASPASGHLRSYARTLLLLRADRADAPWETRPVTPMIVAHQGGWDEALLVLVPVAVFVGLLALANRRAKAIQARRRAEPSEVSDDGAGATPDEPDPRP